MINVLMCLLSVSLFAEEQNNGMEAFSQALDIVRKEPELCLLLPKKIELHDNFNHLAQTLSPEAAIASIQVNRSEENISMRPWRVLAAHRLLRKTNKACWTVVEVDECLEKAKGAMRLGNSERANAAREAISELQASFDRSTCKAKLSELVEKVEQLSAAEKEILRSTNDFHASNPVFYRTLDGLSYHKYLIDPDLVDKAIKAFEAENEQK